MIVTCTDPIVGETLRPAARADPDRRGADRSGLLKLCTGLALLILPALAGCSIFEEEHSSVFAVSRMPEGEVRPPLLESKTEVSQWQASQSGRTDKVMPATYVLIHPQSSGITLGTPVTGEQELPQASLKPATYQTSSAIEAHQDSKAVLPSRAAPAARRSYIDITTHPSFAHAEDYSWLVGPVEYSCIRKGWRIRFASVDEEDLYGGSATLIAQAKLANFKEGQIYRVTGQFLENQNRALGLCYQVRTVEAIDR